MIQLSNIGKTPGIGPYGGKHPESIFRGDHPSVTGADNPYTIPDNKCFHTAQ
jgi:hypothetical protein